MTVKWPPLLPFLFPPFHLVVSLLFFPFSSPSHCEIAVVSYGFLFLRDGRWVHVGVEATKHAVRVHQFTGTDGH